MMASHKSNEWEWQGKKYKIKPSQIITSAKSIAEKAGQNISRQNIRSAIAKFKKYEFLTMNSTKQGMLITIENWDFYQSKEDSPTKEPTNDQPTGNHYQECKELKNKEYVQMAEQLWSIYPKKKGKAKAMAKIPKLLKEFSYEELERAITRYRDETKDTNTQYIKQGDTFFSTGYVDYLDANYQPTENDGSQEDDPYAHLETL
jgi:DNA replication protein DnaD